MSEHKQVLVTGDFVLDHHIYEGRRRHYGDRRHRGVHEVEELGGAALVHYLLYRTGARWPWHCPDSSAQLRSADAAVAEGMIRVQGIVGTYPEHPSHRKWPPRDVRDHDSPNDRQEREGKEHRDSPGVPLGGSVSARPKGRRADERLDGAARAATVYPAALPPHGDRGYLSRCRRLEPPAVCAQILER